MKTLEENTGILPTKILPFLLMNTRKISSISMQLFLRTCVDKIVCPQTGPDGPTDGPTGRNQYTPQTSFVRGIIINCTKILYNKTK